MLNAGAGVDESLLNVLEGIELRGAVNVTDDVLVENIQYAIRQGHPQIRQQDPNYERIALVGGGPSLEDTEQELVDLLREGAKLVTVNGSYHWCLKHNLIPSTQIVVDARPNNARFVNPPLPNCQYVLASQCAPETWDAVKGRRGVWIFHAAAGTVDPIREVLDEYYLGNWVGIGGGVTVITRALSLLRTVGYLRFDLFGVDSCFLNGKHHAYEQAENDHDHRIPFKASPPGQPELERIFYCAPWHAKQLECFLQMIRLNGDHFLLNVHGDGLLAYALKTNAQVQQAEDQKELENGSSSIQDLQSR